VRGGKVILQLVKEIPPFIIFIPVMILLLTFTIITNFNLIGYNYNLEENSTIITVEEGFFNKEIYDIPIYNDSGILVLQEVILPINSANDIWRFDVTLISLFIAVFAELIRSPGRQRKNFKWYILLYVATIFVFVVWNINAHAELLEVIGNLNKRNLLSPEA